MVHRKREVAEGGCRKREKQWLWLWRNRVEQSAEANNMKVEKKNRLFGRHKRHASMSTAVAIAPPLKIRYTKHGVWRFAIKPPRHSAIAPPFPQFDNTASESQII
ncbi:DUF4981 domain-containing protein [Sesbania bispinosa]|nr:DUF4981 domain-containing protein [Sesbania bispinosa]